MKIGRLEININELTTFVIDAKKNTYAKSGEGGEITLPDNSKQLKFDNNKFYYIDTYVGHYRFSGSEVIRFGDRNGEPIWQMNYYGGMSSKFLKDKELCKETFHLLKHALSNVSFTKPFRGPKSYYIDNKLSYLNNSIGGIRDFKGREIISKPLEVVYSLKYHGGIIIPK